MSDRRRRDHDRYVERMGHEPPEPDPEHPLAWQWNFRGTRDERETLEAELRGEPVPDDEPPSQEEALF